MRVRLGVRSAAVIVCVALAVAWRASAAGHLVAAEPLWDTGTFSILGFDPATGEVGGAVQSRVFSVGNGVLWADADAGVAATQAIVDVSYGPHAIELLRKAHETGGHHQPDSRRGSRSAAGELDQGGTAVRRDEPERRVRGTHRSEGDRVGGKQGRQVRHRAGQHPRRARRGRQHGPGVREDRGPLCRSGWSPRSKAVRPAAATSADSSRPRW